MWTFNLCLAIQMIPRGATTIMHPYDKAVVLQIIKKNQLQKKRNEEKQKLFFLYIITKIASLLPWITNEPKIKWKTWEQRKEKLHLFESEGKHWQKLKKKLLQQTNKLTDWRPDRAERKTTFVKVIDQHDNNNNKPTQT